MNVQPPAIRVWRRHCRYNSCLPVYRYLPDNHDGHDVIVDRTDRVRPSVASRVAKATPRPRLASLPHDSLRGARAVHGKSRDRLLRMRTTGHLPRHRAAQSATVETRRLRRGRVRRRHQRSSGLTIFTTSLLYWCLDLFSSTPPSRPNKVVLKCLSARPSVRPSTKSFFNFGWNLVCRWRSTTDAWRLAVWPDPRSRSRSRALESRKIDHFQRLSPPHL